MKIFNGRLATEDYMSSHSLTFSTPEMTLKKFALWLGDQVNDPKTSKPIPRLILYIQDKDISNKSPNSLKNDESDYLPDVDETFKPSGAISDLYGKSTVDKTSDLEKRYCINCGSTIKTSSKFCNKCGFVQEQE
jgi:hypothetical protein